MDQPTDRAVQIAKAIIRDLSVEDGARLIDDLCSRLARAEAVLAELRGAVTDYRRATTWDEQIPHKDFDEASVRLDAAMNVSG